MLKAALEAIALSESLIRISLLTNGSSMGPSSNVLATDYVVGNWVVDDLALSPHWINQHIRARQCSGAEVHQRPRRKHGTHLQRWRCTADGLRLTKPIQH